MNRLQRVLLGLVIAAGLVTLLASSLEDDDIDTPPVPVTVNYTLQTQESGLTRELETRNGKVSGMRLAGSYDANSGDGLTLDRPRVDLDTTSSFTLEIEPSDDELLTGSAAIEITATLDLDLDGDPTMGQFTSVFDGTSTVVDVTNSGVDLTIADASGAISLNWTDFVALEDDADANLDERMASAAYNMLPAVLRATLIVEDIVSDIEANRSTLEGMNTNTPLEVDCDNTGNAGDAPEARLIWTSDAAGTGQGEIGINDSFEARYVNCRNAGRDRFVDGIVVLDNYVPDRGEGLRTLAVDAELRDLYVAEDAIVGIDALPTATSPRYNGNFSLNYVEAAR